MIFETPEQEAAYWKWMARPLEERNASTSASIGICDGDLRPLANYIRAGYAIDSGLAEQILAAIEGPDEEGFTLSLKRDARRRPTWTKRGELLERDIAMAFRFFRLQEESNARGESGVYDELIGKVCEEFGVADGTVRGALRAVRAMVNGEC